MAVVASGGRSAVDRACYINLDAVEAIVLSKTTGEVNHTVAAGHGLRRWRSRCGYALAGPIAYQYDHRFGTS